MENLFDKWSYYVGAISFVVALWITFALTNEFLSSFVAALLTSALTWGSYIVIRMLILSLKK